MQRIFVWAVIVLACVGCSSSFLGEDPPDDPVTVFEEFWRGYDRHYAHFGLKNIDWDDVYARYRPKVGRETSEEELFQILAAMIAELEDGHVYLVGGQWRAFSDGHLRGARRNFDAATVKEYYLLDSSKDLAEGRLRYGWIEGDIGYLRLSTLSGAEGVGDEVKGWIRELDLVLEGFRESRGLILDLRNNGGGRAFNTKYVAGRFATQRKPFVITRSRNGPEHDDFSAPRTWYVEPSGDWVYDRPVVVLTNRFTFSAAEWLTIALRQFDHVIHLGTHTGGGLAMFLPRELPNGWLYTVSIQDTRGPQGQSFERVGVAPHRYVENDDEDAVQGRDTILEAAIQGVRQAQ